MICPHCSRSLQQKQRTGRRCTFCRNEFVFEPKDRLRLHDLRVRKLAGKLGDGGRLRYTVAQLWYAAARKEMGKPGTPLEGCGCGVFLAGVLAVLVIGGVNGFDPGVLRGLAIGVGALVVLANVLIMVRRARLRREAAVSVPMPIGEFRDMILRRWPGIYGAWPPGLVDEERATAPVVAQPRVALVCPDRAVLACLADNGVPQRLGMALTMSPENLPPAVPVVVVHDADVPGCRLAASVRAALPGRVVVDAGLHPRTVLRREGLVRLRRKPFAPAELAGLPLGVEEVGWLSQGWWSPVAAIPPAQLLAAVAAAARRAEGATDPDRRRAERVGFLTWPVP